MRIHTPAFPHGGFVPERYTLVGGNCAPPLCIDNLPERTRSLVLLIDHRMGMDGLCTHWVVYDIPPGPGWTESTVPGTRAINDFEVHRYVGPFPRHGGETYRLRVCALSGVLLLGGGKGRADVERAMRGLVIDEAELWARCGVHRCSRGLVRSVAAYAAALPPKARLPLACQRKGRAYDWK